MRREEGNKLNKQILANKGILLHFIPISKSSSFVGKSSYMQFGKQFL